MKVIILALLVCPLLCAAENAKPTALMAGKVETGRTIFLEATVSASPADVFRLWTTVDGVKKFLAPDARIDATPGGRYQIIFFPSKDPEGTSHGTKGARVLKVIPNREFAFEWITFAGDDIAGQNAPPSAPPSAPPAQRNAQPLPTWVELSFEPISGQLNQTHLKFSHHGFGEGELWDRSYHWFERAWKGVLDQLTNYCQNQNHAEKTEEKS